MCVRIGDCEWRSLLAKKREGSGGKEAAAGGDNYTHSQPNRTGGVRLSINWGKQRVDMSEFAVIKAVAFRVFKIRRNGLLSFNVCSAYRSESPPDSSNSFIAPDRDSARLPRSSNFAPSTSSSVATLNSRGASYGGSYAGSNYLRSYADSGGQRPSEIVYWVEESTSRPRQCLEIVEEEEGHDINGLFEVVVVEIGERKQLQLPPYVCASYLGYVDIVNYLLSRPDLKLTEGKFVTKNRARKAAKWSPALA